MSAREIPPLRDLLATQWTARVPILIGGCVALAGLAFLSLIILALVLDKYVPTPKPQQTKPKPPVATASLGLTPEYVSWLGANILDEALHRFLRRKQLAHVIGLAHQLLQHRTLAGPEAERYLSIAGERLKYDPWMPNAVLVGEVTYVCSPWHREWYAESIATTRKPKRTDLPETIIGLSARVDGSPLTRDMEGRTLSEDDGRDQVDSS